MTLTDDSRIADKLAGAVQLLGWYGVMRWPVVHGGDSLAVVHSADDDPSAGPGGTWLKGCLLPGTGVRAIKHASLLAGYSRRAVLLIDDADALAATVDAAILDVGLVMGSTANVELLVCAGPVVDSPLTRQGIADEQWRRLVADVLAAPVAGNTSLRPVGSSAS